MGEFGLPETRIDEGLTARLYLTGEGWELVRDGAVLATGS